jgi:hypothetical protein
MSAIPLLSCRGLEAGYGASQVLFLFQPAPQLGMRPDGDQPADQKQD